MKKKKFEQKIDFLGSGINFGGFRHRTYDPRNMGFVSLFWCNLFFFGHKASKNHLKIIQKSCTSYLKIVRKACKNRPKIIPNHPKVLPLTPYKPLLDPLELAETYLER